MSKGGLFTMTRMNSRAKVTIFMQKKEGPAFFDAGPSAFAFL
jgi:hypothetical protein